MGRRSEPSCSVNLKIDLGRRDNDKHLYLRLCAKTKWNRRLPSVDALEMTKALTQSESAENRNVHF